jgi:phage tail sheath gpL-like
VLSNRTTYGHSFTFQTGANPSIISSAEPGDKVKISYAEAKSGSMTASAIQYVGAITTSGTVSSIATNGSSVTIQTTGGLTLTLSTSTVTNLIDGLQVGDGVQVTYSKDSSGLLIPHTVQTLS